MSNRGFDYWLGACSGFVATLPLVIAAWGWAASWNAYINLTFTLGAGVLWVSLHRACNLMADSP